MPFRKAFFISIERVSTRSETRGYILVVFVYLSYSILLSLTKHLALLMLHCMMNFHEQSSFTHGGLI